MSIYNDFKKALALNRDGVMLLDSTTRITYAEVDTRTAKVAAGLKSLALGIESRIAVLSPNSADAFVALLGVIRASAAFIPVNVRNSVQMNAIFLRTCECNAILYHSSLRPAVTDILAQCPLIQAAICIDEPSNRDSHFALQELMANASSDDAMEPDEKPDRVVVILATGGTTGASKAAPINNKGWGAYADAALACMPPSGRCSYLVAGPMTHGPGMTGLCFLSLAPTLVVLERPEPIGILAAIEKHAITCMFAPPTLIHMLLECPTLPSTDLSTLEYVLIAASPIAPDKLKEAVRLIGRSVCQSFGQSEAPLFLTFLSNSDLVTPSLTSGVDRYASCGRATPGMQVEIMDDSGNVLAPMSKGEIVARGDLVFAGYYNDPAATAGISTFGWHHTGDLGFKDADGFIYIIDRKRDMIVTGGFNIFSVEVESVIQSHPAVRECAVIGVPDPKWGEAIKAVVELKDGASVDEAEIQSLVRSRLGGVSTPKSVEFWDLLPRSPNGKILKREVRDRFWIGQSRAIG